MAGRQTNNLEGMPGSFSAVVPAAGSSHRMGRLKPLLPLDGRTAVERIISIFRENGLEEIFVVVGYRQSEIEEALASAGVRIVRNSHFREGMFGSIVEGARCMAADTEAFFILPADIPLIRPVTIRLLLSEYEKNPGKIIHPCFHGKRGHPPLIPGKLIGAILQNRPEGGLKALLKDHRSMAVDLEVPDRNILFDLDDPNDYREAQSRLNAYDVPTREECQVLMTHTCPAPDPVMRHSWMVSSVAGSMTEALIQSGVTLDAALIHAAALLHDISKGEKKHAEKGADLLRQMGFPRVADVVAGHTDLVLPEGGRIHEVELVYLSDKLVSGDRLVSLEEKFQQPMDRFKNNPVALENIRRRYANAEIVKQRIEERLGFKLEALLFPEAVKRT